MDLQTETHFRRIGYKKGFLFRRAPELIFGFDLRGMGTLYTSSDPKEILKVLYIMRQFARIKPGEDNDKVGGDHRDMLRQVTLLKPLFPLPRSGFVQWQRKEQTDYWTDKWITLESWLYKQECYYFPLQLPEKKK